MWQNGFSINEDGELRSYKDPANRNFLASVMSGRIPNELVEEAQNGEVHVDIEDHKEEEYQKPKGASGVKAFSGTGHTLGGISPAVNNDPAPVSVEDSHSLEVKAQGIKTSVTTKISLKIFLIVISMYFRCFLFVIKNIIIADELKVDEGQAVATVQIRLHDGKTMKVKLNHSHTIASLRRFVLTARPDLNGRSFSLRTSFPSKELDSDEMNIKEAGLIGAAVLLRLK